MRFLIHHDVTSLLTNEMKFHELVIHPAKPTPNVALKTLLWGFPGGAVIETLPANAGDMGSSPGLGRSHIPQSN